MKVIEPSVQYEVELTTEEQIALDRTMKLVADLLQAIDDKECYCIKTKIGMVHDITELEHVYEKLEIIKDIHGIFY